jgi:hypothetical protein
MLPLDRLRGSQIVCGVLADRPTFARLEIARVRCCASPSAGFRSGQIEILAVCLGDQIGLSAVW